MDWQGIVGLVMVAVIVAVPLLAVVDATNPKRYGRG